MNEIVDPFPYHNTVHHLVSRIAHRVHFLKEDERNDFIAMMRRSAEFSGIRLLGWCIMINHFHILVHLPVPEEIDEAEIIRRVKVLKGDTGASALEQWISAERQKGESGEKNVQRALAKLRRRMYDVGEFMKTLKQWFTQDYNKRNTHVGTLWESSYHDREIPLNCSAMSRVLAYIHLNPIRAAACAGFSDYPWSSFHDAIRGDALAMDGLRFVYDYDYPDCSDDAERAENADGPVDVLSLHREVLEDVLEYEKRKRAEEVARRRAAGYETPDDPLTDEAYVAQAAAHLEVVIKAGVELAEERMRYAKCAEKREEIERKVIEAIKREPHISVLRLSKTLGVAYPTINRYVNEMKKCGRIHREKRGEPWTVI